MCHFSISTKPHPGINTFSQTTCLTVCSAGRPPCLSHKVNRARHAAIDHLFPAWQRSIWASGATTSRRHTKTLLYTLTFTTCTRLYLLASSATSQARGRGQADTRSSAVSLQQVTVICELSTLRMSQTMRSMSGSVSAEPPGSRLIGSTSLSRWTIVGCRLVRTR